MNKYDVLGRVGEGAYGVVLRCKNKDTNEVVAIKKFKESEEDEVVRKTTLREIKILRILRHENIVQLKEAFRRNKKLYLVFEFVEKSMLDILEENERGVDTETVRVLTYQLTRAIEYCHKQEVIHRDIKPENLLINPADNALRLCDFGFARHFTTESPLTDYVATRWYRAPELLLCSTNYGKDVDIWALGCIMGELTDGQPLFAGETEVDMLFMIQKVLGALTAEHMEMFLRNPRFLGVQFPDVSRPETLEKRYMRRMPKLQMQLLKGVLAMEPKRRLTAKDAVRMPWFEGVKLPRSLRPPSQTHAQLRPDSSNSVAAHSRDREARDTREARVDAREPRGENREAARETREPRDVREMRDPQAMASRSGIAGAHLGGVAAPQAAEPTWLDPPEPREAAREEPRAQREESFRVPQREEPRMPREEPLRVARDDPRMLREGDARPRTEQQQRRTVFEDSILEVGPSPEYGNMPLHFGEVDDKMSDGRRSRQQRRQGTAETVCSTTSNGGGALDRGAAGPGPGAATSGAGGPRLWVSAGTGGSEEWPSAQLSRAPRSLREPDGPEDAVAAWGQNGLPRRKVGRQPTGLGAIPPQTRRTPELVDQWQPPGDPRNQAWDVPQDLKEVRPPAGAGGLPLVTGPFPLGPQGLPGQMLGEISRAPSRLAANTPTPREDALDLAKLHSFGLGAEFGHVRDLRSLHHEVRPPAQALTALGRR